MRNNILLYFLGIVLILFPLSADAQETMAENACAPVFTSETITPNILIILDNSRSMNNMAYGYDAQDYYHPDGYVHDPANNPYYGYFNPNLKYTYTASGRFEVDAGGDWDGNFLNWLTMRRVDLAKKVLVGGKCTSAVCTGPQKLGGEVPGVNVSEYKFFKFSPNSDAYTPAQFGNDCIFKVSYGKFEVFRIDEPGAFWAAYNAADYKMYNCDEIDFDEDGKTSYLDHEEINYNGHHAFFEGYLFKYLGNQGDGLLNATGHYYDIYQDTGAGGGCDYVPVSGEFTKYDESAPINKLSYTTTADAEFDTTFNIDVYKEPAVEPEEFLTIGGKVTIVGVLDRIVQRENARFGLEYFYTGDKTELGNNKDGGYISGAITKKMKEDLIAKDMKTDIRNQSCEAFCPLAEAFNVAVHYFRQDYDPYSYINGAGSFTINAQHDPFNYDGVYPDCGKNFVLLITDGESTMDNNIPDVPAGIRDYDGDSGGDDGMGTAANDYGTDYLDDLALWAHTEDMRPGDIPGDQVINLYTVRIFGSGSQLLKDACKNGGFNDRDGDKIPDGDMIPGNGDAGNEFDEDDNGIPDTYFEAQQGTDLQAQLFAAINAILQQAASGTAVSILSTSAEGEGSLFQAFFKPLVFDNLREVHWTGYLNALWVDPYGNLREDTVQDDALVYSEDKIIKFAVDSFSGDTAIERYHDSDGDGEADIVAPATEPVAYETALLEGLETQWEAGEKLAKRDASTRKIYTWVDVNGNGDVDYDVDVNGDGTDEGEFIPFTTDYDSVLRPFLDVDTDTEAANIISYIRGNSVSTAYRDRNITIDGTEYVWKLGDIVYSTPTVVGRPMENYHLYYGDTGYHSFLNDVTAPGLPADKKLWRDRGVTVYVGANDGMLHAFKAGTFNEGDNDGTPLKEEHGWYSATEYPATTEALGDERWAYIPYNLLPHLQWLKEPAYPHVYYVDLKPKVSDVRIFSDAAGNPMDANHPDGWGTVLIGGMRLGGGEYDVTRDFDGDGPLVVETRTFRSAYFVLDITVPGSPVLLGEGTDPDLGFTTSYPAIARVEATKGFQTPEDDEWYGIVGSGPTDCSGNSDQDGYIFIFNLNLQGGEVVVKKYGPLESRAFMASPIAIDIDLNYNVEGIYIGETYDPGNDDDPENDRGRMHHISTRDDPLPIEPDVWAYETYNAGGAPFDKLNWTRSTFFDEGPGPSDYVKPITASATASIDNESIDFGNGVIHGNIWIYFGTGRFHNDLDKSDATQQSFYGIKDDLPYGGRAAAVLNDSDIYDSTTVDILTNKQVEGATATEWDAFIAEVQQENGWKIDLNTPGERVLNRPNILGGVVLFAPFLPDDNICSYGGSGSVYALYYETGTAYPADIMGTADYGDGRTESLKMKTLDKGMTSEIGLHVGQKATSTGFIQQGTGSVEQIEVDPAFGIKSGIIGWKQY